MANASSFSRAVIVGLAVALALSGCAKRVGSTKAPAPVRLLTETAEAETASFKESREDVEIDTRDHDRTPKVVARGETALLPAEGLVVKLYGDEAASKGFSVDNLILLEVLSENGKVVNRAAIGFSDLVMMSSERVDNIGRQAFNFEPGEIQLSSLLPDHGFYRLRATVLDYYGIGRNTDVWLVFSGAGEAQSGSSDELRGQ
jgi:hypothetical protein